MDGVTLVSKSLLGDAGSDGPTYVEIGSSDGISSGFEDMVGEDESINEDSVGTDVEMCEALATGDLLFELDGLIDIVDRIDDGVIELVNCDDSDADAPNEEYVPVEEDDTSGVVNARWLDTDGDIEAFSVDCSPNPLDGDDIGAENVADPVASMGDEDSASPDVDVCGKEARPFE